MICERHGHEMSEPPGYNPKANYSCPQCACEEQIEELREELAALKHVTCPECEGTGRHPRVAIDCDRCGGGGEMLLKAAIEWLVETVKRRS